MKRKLIDIKFKLNSFSQKGNWQNVIVEVLTTDLFWLLIICGVFRLIFYFSFLNTVSFPDSNSYLNYSANNLNTGGVIAILLSVAEEPMTHENYSLMLEFDKILGLDIENAELRLKEIDEILAESNPNEKLAMDLLKKRDQFRRNKMFKEADECRMEIEKLNFRVEDSPMGSKLKPILNKI
jgi:hypothetical protein